MYRFPLFLLVLVSLFAFCDVARADEVTFFGDFEDGFGTVDAAYSSDVPYDPGVGILAFSEMVVGIPKFDESLGVLTDIIVFVDETSPIFYTLGGGMEVTELDASAPGYSASMSLFGDVLLNYMGESTMTPVLGDPLPLSGGDAGEPGTGSFTTGVTMGADGMLTGESSIFGTAALADFVGTGDVESLFVEMFVEATAEFIVDNATATAGLGFDVFDSDSGADDAVIGVTYVYSVPEPGSSMILIGVSALFFRRRRSRSTVNGGC